MNRFLTAILILACTTLPASAQFGSFGVSATFSDDAIVVGQPSGREAGKIFTFRQLPDEGWQRVAEFSAPDSVGGEFFGYYLYADGEYLYVGAPSMEAGQGAIYVLIREPEADGYFRVVDKITGAAEDHIGASVVITDNMIVTGGMDDSAHVTVFERSEDSWQRTGIVSAEGLEDGAYFGLSVAMDDENLYVGAPGANEGAGAVVVFSLPDFVQETVLTAGDSAVVALGVSLLPTGNGTLLAGAPGVKPNVQPAGPPPPGAVVGFARGADGMWTETSSMSGGGGDQFDIYGFSMLTDGSGLWVSAILANQYQGRVYEFTRGEAGHWSATDTISAEGTITFGQALAKAADLLVVTAPASGQGVGAAYVFRSADDGWELDGTLVSGAEPPEPTPRETAGIDMVPSDGPSECADSLAWQFGCSNVDLLAFLPLSAVGGEEGTTAADIWGWTDPESGREYALLARNNGTAFIDMGDPANPVYLGSLAMTEGSAAAAWRDVKVYSNHAFVVADNAGDHGMQVFDLTQLRSVEDAPATFEATALYDGISSAHNIVINEDTGFAFAVGSSGGGEVCGGGLHMINIQDPLHPTFAGCFAHEGTGSASTGYAHDAQCVSYHGPDAEHVDKEVCLGSNETALSIADVTDKENPVVIGSASYPNVGYSHQGWLTDDHRYFYMNDELDELQGEVVGTRTLIWDLTDLDDPLLAAEFKSDNKSSDHNLYIQGDVMYQSNYKSGLRIFDISDRLNPAVLGFFDTFPGGEDNPGFAGSWSNYPYFKSGAIIVSSMGEGLFILKRQSIDI